MRFSDDQRALRATARDFANEHLAPNAIEWDRTKHFPVDVLRKAAQLGMGAICIAEDVGGCGLSRLDSVLVFEALATGCPSIAAYLSIHNMVASMIDRFGNPEQRQALLPDLVTMARLGSYCLTEPGAGSDAAALRTTARRIEGGYTLDGVKQFISGGGVSDVYLVLARTGATGAKGISAFVVDRDNAGISFGPNEKKMGWNAQPTCQVVLDDARVSESRLLGAEGAGFGIAMSALGGGRLNIAACSVGGAQAALEMAISHLGSREAFGAPLAHAQALRFRIADMHTELEAARTLLWRAADAYDNGDPDAGALCAMAKRFATDVGFEVANQALQLHGGYGYLSEYGVEKIVRDLRVHQILEGTNEIMRVIVSRGLLGADS